MTVTRKSQSRTRTPAEHSHALQCMEIWGGSDSFDNAVSVPGIDAWVYSKPHAGSDAGGDVYYVSMCGGGKIARFFLADLSGHGAEASAPADDLRKLMRRYINTVDQTRFVRSLNDRMSDWSQSGRFATAALTTYFAPHRQLLVCNAGHPPPLWYRAAAGEWQWLTTDASGVLSSADNLPMGIIKGTEYTQFAVQLETNDLVLLYSDSLFEARNREGRQLGLNGLLQLMQGLDTDEPRSIPHVLVRQLNGWKESAELDDDLTLMLLHHHGSGRVEHSIGERMRTMGRMLGLLPI